MLTLIPWLGWGLPRFSTDIENVKLISVYSKYLFNVCHVSENTLSSRVVMLIPVCKSRGSVKTLKHTFLGSASRAPEPVGLRDVSQKILTVAWVERQREIG